MRIGNRPLVSLAAVAGCAEQVSTTSRLEPLRGAEMEDATGKLSDADWRAVDRQLRAEAVEILQRLDELGVR